MSSSSSFRLVSRLSAVKDGATGTDTDTDSGCLIPVSKYISERTGMHVYACHVSGPVVKGYFSVATEARDDDGLPHTLEHVVFLGSEDYPYAGVLDILANKIYAAGTNAWTEVDNTTYTLATLEKHGFFQLLPIYLDHILYPLLNESGFITEVYHVNEEGEDAGVVYSEMQSVETEEENVVDRAMHRAMYPDAECGYRYETGGVLHNLRTSCSHKKVVEFHKQMYRPNNMAVIVTGQIQDDELIEVLSKFEEKILSKEPQKTQTARPFSYAIAPLASSVEETVTFPCNAEANTNGIVSVNWRGPHITHVRELIAFDLLFYYLAHSSISPLQAYFVQSKSFCNKIEYKIYEYAVTILGVNFTNVPLDTLSRIKTDLMQLLRDLVDKRTTFDMARMQSIVKMKIAEIIDKHEDSPHDTVSHLCIIDFLYGNSQNELEFKQRFTQVEQFENLKDQSVEYWLDLIDKYLLNAHSVTIIGKPSESLMHSIAQEEETRVENRRKSLGKKGLKDCKRTVENAIAQNDGEDVPDDLFNKITVPSLENVKLKDLTQFFTYSSNNNSTPTPNGDPPAPPLIDSLKHLQMQVDHLRGTNFMHVVLLVDTQRLDVDLRDYLELYISLLFELPVECAELGLSLTHEQVVYELNKDLLEFDASVGIQGSQFIPGTFSNYLSIFVKTPINDYELAIKWLKLIAFHTVFDRKQIKIAVQNLLKEIKQRKLQPQDLIQSMTVDLYFKPESNLYKSNFMRQEAFLTQILDELNSETNNTQTSSVEKKLELVRDQLLGDKQLRFYMCADLDKFEKQQQQQQLGAKWIEYFGPTLEYNKRRVFASGSAPFDVIKTRAFKHAMNSTSTKQECVYTSAPRRDFIVSLGSTESAYIKSTASCDVDTHLHSKYPALLVLFEYFCQTEGPLWEAVRGPGFCYSQSIHLSPEKSLIELNLDECSNLSKAYEATRNIFLEHLKDELDANLFESAKNSLIFLLLEDLISISNYSSYSMLCYFKGFDLNRIQELIKKINNVHIDEMKPLIKDYIMPLFNNETSNCLIVSQPAKTPNIIKEFEKKYDRKLNLIDKVEDCLQVSTSS